MSGNLQEYPSAYNIQNNTWLTYGKPHDGKMYIFMLPTTALKQFGIKKPIDVVAHWALCINGICYELQRTDNKGKYDFGWKTEPDFVKYRHEKQNKGIVYGELGYMARLYPHGWIKEVDQWVKAAGNARDGSFFAIAAGASLMSVASVAAGVGVVAVSVRAAAKAVYAVFTISEALYAWATSSSDEARVPQEVVQARRIEAAGRLGTVGTTTETTRYPAHPSFQSLSLFDVPGAGTLSVPAEGYYNLQELFTFDLLLVVWVERLGETEINIIESCILDDESDEDTEESRQRARETAVLTTAEALEGQLKRAGVPGKALEELLGFCVLVNKNDVRRLSSTDYAEDWPDPRESMTEVHERLLLETLGKRRLDASPPSSEGEDTDDEKESRTAEDL
ncbi:hypothetical protein CMUS01_05229 [Colletotrichum musicola]|uniref:Uncharacterized protein n=1 Tax=Colletotrichum musicola TaxID=2175873 RepID=A0A8H6NLE2_9PEZI|nr:hypothetical protein CMUS01_05229 [Colletotrichum musicola]